MSIALEQVESAAEFLRERIRRTPLESSDPLSKLLGAPAWLKLESLQLTGSFKIRGALFRLSKLTHQEREDGVVTCSAGNHGKAVAYAARQANVRATICVPRTVDQSKLAGMIAQGADVRVSDFDGYDDTETWAQELARTESRTFISAFDDYDIMAANGGTVAKEVLEDAPAARRFILPVGGGGLGAGFAVWTKHHLPNAEIVACQHHLSPGLEKSIQAGRAIMKLPAVETMAGGVEGGIGALTFDILRGCGKRGMSTLSPPATDWRHSPESQSTERSVSFFRTSLLTDVALVTENEILEAVRWMLSNHQYLIEPTAAVALAACLTGKIAPSTQPTVVVITGRNVSAESLKKILCAS